MRRNASVIYVYIVYVVCDYVITTVNASLADNVVYAARCRVRCLAELQQSVERDLPLMTSLLPASLAQCLQDPTCTACLKPCSQPFINLPLCQKTCEQDHSHACEFSCQYLNNIHSNHVGTCPSPTSIASLLPPPRADGRVACASFSDLCHSDGECDSATEKCCSEPCGHMMCLPAEISYADIPSIPDSPVIVEKTKGGVIELRWNQVNVSSAEPVLYIVDQRWSVGKHHSEGHSSDWQQITQTTHNTARVQDITPGFWYEYRVSAVNIHGCRGPSLSSAPFSLKREPSPPSPPENLTEGDIEVSGASVSLNIHWLPPTKSDLPVTRYKIFWSKESTSPVHENRRLISGDQLWFTVPDLEIDSSYIVQVQAISQYGDTRLKSERVSLHTNTFALPMMSDMQAQPTQQHHKIRTHMPALSSLTARNPYFESGSLRVNITWEQHEGVKKVLIYWSPEVCIADSAVGNTLARPNFGTTEMNYFLIEDLNFDCRYEVRIQPVSLNGVTGPESHISFPTPSCTEVIVKGASRPDCPSQAASMLDEPANFQHFVIVTGSSNFSVRLSWTLETNPDYPVTGYRLTWGEAAEAHPPIMDKSSALTKVLSKHEISYTLRGLKEATKYIVQLQALFHTTASRAATLQIVTPTLQSTPHGSPYVHFSRVTQSSIHHLSSSKNKQQQTLSRSNCASIMYNASFIPLLLLYCFIARYICI